MGTPNYWDYLKINTLLTLQDGLEDESQLIPDELHFIITHQVFELWFKLALAELRHARDHLAAPEVPEEKIPYVVHHLRRVNRVLNLLVSSFEVMETLTPQDFLSFRDKLTPSSGFQSFQMRELEMIMGMQSAGRLRYGKTNALEHIRALSESSPTGAMAWGRLKKASEEQSIRSALHEWLYRTPIQGSSPDEPGDSEAVDAFLTSYIEAIDAHHTQQADRLIDIGLGNTDDIRARFANNTEQARLYLSAEDVEEEAERPRRRRIRAALVYIESYRTLPLLAWPRLLVDTMVEFEEQMVLFRTRHARMVERIIGRRVGTGGSSGVDYLDKTTRIRIFTDLWGARTLLLPKDRIPPVHNAEFYGFATE
ncbi:MAG: tryptophan 2,3-dioxygenase family protein [Myxococcota bacterium]|nr:tryptophan 2,3-dioxygenase family protein [Myxococcota bacterium]